MSLEKSDLNGVLSVLKDAESMPFVHDAMYLYGIALNACLSDVSGRCDHRDGHAIKAFMNCQSFHGASGYCILDSRGERRPIFHVLGNAGRGSFSKVLTIFPSAACSDGDDKIHATIIREPLWSTKDGNRPADTPRCGFNDELCLEEKIYPVLVAFGITILLIAILVIVLHTRRKEKLEHDIFNMAWKIDRSDIFPVSDDIALKSFTSLTETAQIRHFNRPDGGYVGPAKYNSMTCAQKLYIQKSSFNLLRDELLFLKQAHEISHANLNSFMGMTSDAGPHLIVLWDFCRRGSLDDVLFNEEVELDSNFKASILNDIAKGMKFLHHSPIRCHGMFGTAKCLVDNRWNIKITDFGFDNFCTMMQDKKIIERRESSWQDLFHQAPEQLRDQGIHRLVPDQKWDIYSMGMVFYQVITREPLFEYAVEKTNSEIVDCIKTYIPAQDPFRPIIPNRMLVEGLVQNTHHVIAKCWNEDPEKRPKIAHLKAMIDRATADFREGSTDNTLLNLEKYSSNADRIIYERTVQLDEERRKNEELIHHLIPRSVAANLKSGAPIDVISKQMSVCRLEIVDFLPLIESFKQVDLLSFINSYYTGLDDIVEQCDIVKIRTLNDNMVFGAEGSDVNSRHVAEICDFSLKILKYSHEASLKLCQEKLVVKLGLDSGVVTAGVTGSHIPKYCGFGEAIDNACILATYSKGMKIQVSSATFDIINSTGEQYDLQLRGMIHIQGKGMCNTYWLNKKGDHYM